MKTSMFRGHLKDSHISREQFTSALNINSTVYESLYTDAVCWCCWCTSEKKIT